jgi:hypothetical protein
MQSGSTAKTVLVVGPGETAFFDFALAPAKPMSGFMQARVYVASECAFGLVGTNLLFGREETP